MRAAFVLSLLLVIGSVSLFPSVAADKCEDTLDRYCEQWDVEHGGQWCTYYIGDSEGFICINLGEMMA